jgi:hypothetical protein
MTYAIAARTIPLHAHNRSQGISRPIPNTAYDKPWTNNDTQFLFPYTV